MYDFDLICKEVEGLSRRTGAMIREEVDKVISSDIRVKGLHDYVTYVDKNAEEKIVRKLQALIPEAGFIVEENTINKQGKTFTWVVDPLDGTTNFIHGIPLYSVSIALMHKEEVVLGVVYEPNRDECFRALAGKGAFLNGKPIHVSQSANLRESLIATGFPYHDYSRMPAFLEMFQWCMKNTHGLRRLGSAALDLAYLACGRFEAFYEYGLNAWDVAAGSLIVKEAGGKVTDFSGSSNYLFGKEIVAANAAVFDPFQKKVNALFAKNK